MVRVVGVVWVVGWLGRSGAQPSELARAAVGRWCLKGVQGEGPRRRRSNYHYLNHHHYHYYYNYHYHQHHHHHYYYHYHFQTFGRSAFRTGLGSGGTVALKGVQGEGMGVESLSAQGVLVDTWT